MKRQKLGFKESKTTTLGWYDLREDWSLIESSLAKQYGIRIRSESDMSWTEFCSLVGGLMPDTPLGQIVGIRAESDAEAIRNFTPDQKRIHSDWESKQASKRLENTEQLEKDMEALANMFASMFGKGV